MGSLAIAIKTMREKRGYSLNQLAQQAGITKSHVWELEKGTSYNPRIDTLARIAVALDVSPQGLFLQAMDDWHAHTKKHQVVHTVVQRKSATAQKGGE